VIIPESTSHTRRMLLEARKTMRPPSEFLTTPGE
jgi:hypothetical protein